MDRQTKHEKRRSYQKMKKKWLAGILTVGMLFASTPTTLFAEPFQAESEQIVVEETEVEAEAEEAPVVDEAEAEEEPVITEAEAEDDMALPEAEAGEELFAAEDGTDEETDIVMDAPEGDVIETESGVPEGTVFQEEVIGQTEDGQDIYGGYVEAPEDTDVPLMDDVELENEALTASSIPATYNPKASGFTGGYKLPAVRNQNPYGTCWTFGSLASAEMSLARKYNVSKDLSELQLAYFTYHGGKDPVGGTAGDSVSYLSNASENYLDRGGNYIYSTVSLMNWRGAADESTVPYSKASSTLSNGLSSGYEYNKDTAHVQGYYLIDIKTNPNGAKKAIMTYGAVAASYYHSDSYYNSSTNAYYNYSSAYTNHAISIVGWDDNFSKTNFKKQPSRNGAWLIRNSWGKDNMSKYGYFWMSYEDTSLKNAAYVFLTEPANNYGHNYQYDGSIASVNINMASGGKMVAANVFQANSNAYEELKAVSFVLPENSKVNYKIRVYKDLKDASNPESGTLISSATTTGTTSYAGAYTVKLNKSVVLKKGTTFATIVELEKSGESISVQAEQSTTLWNSIKCVATAKKGQSFFKSGTRWVDYGVNHNKNFRIKAYTSNITPATYKVTFNANGGSVGTASKTVVSGDVYGTLPTPTKSNSQFLGWFTDPNSGTQIKSGTTVTIKANQTLYAHWKTYGTQVGSYGGKTFIKGSDGKTRCYNEKNQLVTNQFAFDGSYTYYMQADGTSMKDRLTYHPDGEHIIYFDTEGHEVFTNFQYCPSVGYTCYFDSQGYLYKDQITFVGNSVYYLNANGAMEQGGWFQFANGLDYGFANSDGTLITTGFSYDPYGRVVFYHWNGMVARGLISDGVYYYSMDTTDGHYLGQFPVQ